MNRDKELKLLELITYMLASARQLPGEPAHYGPIRLVEATIRLLHVLDDEPTPPAWIGELRDALEETTSVVMTDSEHFVQRLDEHMKRIASLLVGEE